MHFFTPGPAQLYPSVAQHLQQALNEHIPSISHRSSQFRSIYQSTAEALRAIFDLPSSYRVLFTSSATEVWERSLQGGVHTQSFHLVNGAFSEKYYQTALQLGKKALKAEVALGQGFEIADLEIPTTAELVAITHNETATGVQMSIADIHKIKALAPQALVVVDMVSSAPIPALDFEKIDAAFFSVQKAFGLPAGLGVWLVNEACVARAESLVAQGMGIGSYHRLTALWKQAQQYETPATPNVLGIYLLGKVAQDMLQYGITQLRHDITQRAAALYQFFEQEAPAGYSVFVEKSAHRSDTVVVVNTPSDAGEIIKKLAAQGLMVGSGYQDKKNTQLRIANFPASSHEDMAALMKAIKNLD